MSASTLLNEFLLEAGMPGLSSDQEAAFATYFSLLTKWNAKLNLTAIRDAETILRRHFLECIFCANKVPHRSQTLLDFGSGGGFPGIPIAICRPDIQVTLAESQSKKVAFLREVVRTLALSSSVVQGRAETLVESFDVVTLRAVDKMEQAIQLAADKVSEDGWLLLMAGLRDQARFQELAPGIIWQEPISIPCSLESCILLGHRLNKPIS
jgi:16S rRNA (guanine527-N7)-methyltransferase